MSQEDSLFSEIPELTWDIIARLVPGGVALAVYLAHDLTSLTGLGGLACSLAFAYAIGYGVDLLGAAIIDYRILNHLIPIIRRCFRSEHRCKYLVNCVPLSEAELFRRRTRLKEDRDKRYALKLIAERAFFRSMVVVSLFMYFLPPMFVQTMDMANLLTVPGTEFAWPFLCSHSAALPGLASLIVSVNGLYWVSRIATSVLSAPHKGLQPPHGSKAPAVMEHLHVELARAGDPDLLLETLCCPNPHPTRTAASGCELVYRLWADARGGTITATWVDAREGPHLKIEFVSVPNTCASNVTLRPGGPQPLARRPGEDLLCFDARTTPGDGDLPAVCLAFRLIDFYGTQWLRRDGPDVDLTETLTTGDWKRVAIPLDDGKWAVFTEDGNHRYPASSPVINRGLPAFVIELRNPDGANRPGPRSGRILVRNVRFERSRSS